MSRILRVVACVTVLWFSLSVATAQDLATPIDIVAVEKNLKMLTKGMPVEEAIRMLGLTNARLEGFGGNVFLKYRTYRLDQKKTITLRFSYDFDNNTSSFQEAEIKESKPER